MEEYLIKQLGLLGLLIFLVIILFLNPDKASIWASWIHIYILRGLFKASQRKSVSLELQGKINPLSNIMWNVISQEHA